jgi:hypothetical protein
MSTDSCCIVVAQHHCRSCGQLFCGTCSSKRLILPHKEVVNDFKGKVRVCTACFDQLCILYPPEAVNATSSSAMPAMIPLVESARTSSKILLLGGKVIDLYSQSTSSMRLNSDPCVLCVSVFQASGKSWLVQRLLEQQQVDKEFDHDNNDTNLDQSSASTQHAGYLPTFGYVQPTQPTNPTQPTKSTNQINQPTQPTNSTNQLNQPNQQRVFCMHTESLNVIVASQCADTHYQLPVRVTLPN